MVVSEAFAERYLRDIDPVGQRLEIRAQGKPVQTEIVGVVPSLRHERLDQAPRAEVLLPFAQAPTGSMTLVARTSVDPATLIETTKREIWTIDPMQTFYRTATLEELVDRTLDHAALRADRPDRIRRTGAAAGGRGPLRRVEHDRVAVPARRSACAWRSAPAWLDILQARRDARPRRFRRSASPRGWLACSAAPGCCADSCSA